MADGGTVVIHINGDASGFEDEMDGAKESAESAGKESDAIFKGVFKSAVVTKGISMVTKGAAAMGKAIVGAGKAVVGSYADYEQLVGGVDTLFGGVRTCTENLG